MSQELTKEFMKFKAIMGHGYLMQSTDHSHRIVHQRTRIINGRDTGEPDIAACIVCCFGSDWHSAESLTRILQFANTALMLASRAQDGEGIPHPQEN